MGFALEALFAAQVKHVALNDDLAVEQLHSKTQASWQLDIYQASLLRHGQGDFLLRK